MTTITTDNGIELTPDQIASMSEVIAEYMGYEVKIINNAICVKLICWQTIISWAKYHSSWDWLHEVWEKVREEKVIINSEMEGEIYSSFMSGNKLQAFEAVFNAIQFINQLKQTENGNK